ncbi:hypothetical protein D3C77_637780 [compost metagenome]
MRPTLLLVNTTEASSDSFSSGSRVLVSMKVASTLMCITRMKLSPDSCSSGVRGPMIEALFSRPSRRPNWSSIITASSSYWCGRAVSRLNGITTGCGCPAASIWS